MTRVEQQSEQKTAGRWLLAGCLLLLSFPVLGGPLLLLAPVLGELFRNIFGTDDGAILVLSAMLLAVAVAAAAAWCILVAVILYISSESRPG